MFINITGWRTAPAELLVHRLHPHLHRMPHRAVIDLLCHLTCQSQSCLLPRHVLPSVCSLSAELATVILAAVQTLLVQQPHIISILSKTYYGNICLQPLRSLWHLGHIPPIWDPGYMTVCDYYQMYIKSCNYWKCAQVSTLTALYSLQMYSQCNLWNINRQLLFFLHLSNILHPQRYVSVISYTQLYLCSFSLLL